MRETTVVKIAIVDDHQLFRNGLASLLSSYDDIDIIAEAENGKEIIHYLEKASLLPDVILLDVSMPVMNGYEVTENITAHWPQVTILALSMYNDEHPVIMMLQKGASGFVSKNSSPDVIHKAILNVYNKGYFYPEHIKGYLSHSMSKDKKLPQITEREMDFLGYVCMSKTYSEIAREMGVSKRTVENYSLNLCHKLNVKNRIGLVMLAVKLGLNVNNKL